MSCTRTPSLNSTGPVPKKRIELEAFQGSPERAADGEIPVQEIDKGPAKKSGDLIIHLNNYPEIWRTAYFYEP